MQSHNKTFLSTHHEIDIFLHYLCIKRFKLSVNPTSERLVRCRVAACRCFLCFRQSLNLIRVRNSLSWETTSQALITFAHKVVCWFLNHKEIQVSDALLLGQSTNDRLPFLSPHALCAVAQPQNRQLSDRISNVQTSLHSADACSGNLLVPRAVQIHHSSSLRGESWPFCRLCSLLGVQTWSDHTWPKWSNYL